MSTRRASADLFEGKTARRLVAVFGIAVAVTLYFSLTVEEPSPSTALPSAYSRSALGYEALSEALSESGMRVLVSRWRSGRRAAPDVPVLLLEPLPEHIEELTDALSEAEGSGAAVVIGLPKWWGETTWNGWMRTVALAPTAEPAAVLSVIAGESLPESAVYRVEEDTSVSCTSALGSADIPHSLQLIDPGAASFLSPVIQCGGGILVGKARYGSSGVAWVVSDPDFWNTHGLAKPDNPPLAEALLRKGLGARGVIIDETIHGFEHPPSIWQELTTFPLSLFSAHLAGLFLLSVLAAAVRFGAPRTLPPRVPPGKGALIENTARLMDMGGFRATTVQQYFDATIRRLSEALSLPNGLSRAEQVDRIEQHCTARGLSARPTQLAKTIAALPQNCSPRRALALAHRIRALRAELKTLPRSPHAG
ncbi:MAG: hypothetical protein ACI8RZ_004998 [Myxococcota bacterium]|jgi:hypothetical protein